MTRRRNHAVRPTALQLSALPAIVGCGFPIRDDIILGLVEEVEETREAIRSVRHLIGPRENLDPAQGGCEGAWDEQLIKILDALGEIR